MSSKEADKVLDTMRAREVAVEVRGPSAARALLPPGRGRGSSVSSVVCYLTGLSHVDPVKSGLFLGRFLNEEITEAPDIDLDFPRDVREVLIPRIHRRYGSERSALVAAFGLDLGDVIANDPEALTDVPGISVSSNNVSRTGSSSSRGGWMKGPVGRRSPKS